MALFYCQNICKGFATLNGFIRPSFNINFVVLETFPNLNPASIEVLTPKSAFSLELGPIFIPTLFFNEKLFKQFMQIYIDIVKN